MSIVLSGNRENYALMTTILSWTGMVVMSSLYLTIPLISLFSDYFNISLAQAGFTSSVFSLGFALGCFFYGAISEKYGRKNVIVFGLFSLSMITLLLGLVNDFSVILLLRGLQGLAAATFSPVALAYTLEIFPNDRKVGAIGFISTGFLVAGIVGQVFSGYVSEHSHWHVIFYVLASVYVITALLVVWILPKGVLQNQSKNICAPLKKIGIIFTNRNLIFSYIIAFVLKMALCLSIISLTVMSFVSTIAGLTIISILFVGGIALAVPSLVTLVSQLGWNMGGIAVSMYTVILFAGTSVAPFISVYFIQTGSFTVAFLLLATTLSIGLVSALMIKSGRSVGSN
ncbi:MFS transporter [Lysinibacillus sp. GbtcB16]|uniref:MFS transporter n=1 Tax=Lysinibacillus sp. GbtcB16 TaxID=2824761 RepID=UPI001C2F1102|nr:MFS transporter [Lysinibacillus sp. GbtcB16]